MTNAADGYGGKSCCERIKKALAGPMAEAIHLRYAGLLQLSVNYKKMSIEKTDELSGEGQKMGCR